MTAIFDMETIITYVKANWRSGSSVVPDEIIFNKGSVAPKFKWMYVNCLHVKERDTQYSLLDMWANADMNNDTAMDVLSYSKVSSDNAKDMKEEFVYWIQQLAHLNTIDVSAFLQLTDSEPMYTRYYTIYNFGTLLTRRGKGHGS